MAKSVVCIDIRWRINVGDSEAHIQFFVSILYIKRLRGHRFGSILGLAIQML